MSSDMRHTPGLSSTVAKPSCISTPWRLGRPSASGTYSGTASRLTMSKYDSSSSRGACAIAAPLAGDRRDETGCGGRPGEARRPGARLGESDLDDAAARVGRLGAHRVVVAPHGDGVGRRQVHLQLHAEAHRKLGHGAQREVGAAVQHARDVGLRAADAAPELGARDALLLHHAPQLLGELEDRELLVEVGVLLRLREELFERSGAHASSWMITTALVVESEDTDPPPGLELEQLVGERS